MGKTLENARIEVLEEWEQDELRRHRRRFQQRKEAELMETQRVEAARKRRTDETERRNLQQRTVKNQRGCRSAPWSSSSRYVSRRKNFM